jgi:O-antigen/teichoic acid export membrane protein
MEQKSKKPSFGSDSFFMFLGSTSTSIFSVFLGMVLVRYFTDKTIFATYSQSIFLAQTLVAFAPLGLHRAIIFFLPRVESKKALVLQLTILTTLSIIILGIGLIFLREEVGHWFNNSNLSRTVPVVCGIIWTLNLQSILLQVLVGTRRSKLAGIIFAIASISQVGVIFLGIHLNFDVYRMLLLIFANHTAQAMIALWFIFKLPGRLKQVVNISTVIAPIKFALPLGLSSFTGIIGKSIDRLLIMSIFSSKIFAVYDRGAITIPIIEQIPYSIFSVLQPNFVEMYQNNDIKGFIELWHDALIKCAKIMLPIMTLAWIVADPLIIVLNTDAYLESAKYFRIYLFLIPLHLTVYPSILMAVGHTGKVLRASSFFLVNNICLSILFVKVFKMSPVGPALATVISELILAVVYLYTIAKSLKVRFSSVYPWKNLLQTSAICVLSGFLIYPITKIKFSLFQLQVVDLNKLLALACSSTLYVLLYVVLGISFKIITWKEIVEFKKLISFQ